MLCFQGFWLVRESHGIHFFIYYNFSIYRYFIKNHPYHHHKGHVFIKSASSSGRLTPDGTDGIYYFTSLLLRCTSIVVKNIFNFIGILYFSNSYLVFYFRGYFRLSYEQTMPLASMFDISRANTPERYFQAACCDRWRCVFYHVNCTINNNTFFDEEVNVLRKFSLNNK